jgi:glucan phosphorylase
MLKGMKTKKNKNSVAYFCAEFALDNDLPTYAGGLGILAADTLNTAAAKHYPMVGIGLLYKGREFNQQITGSGKEEKRDSEFDYDTSFLRPTTVEKHQLKFNIPTPTGSVSVKSYHVRLSVNVSLFFLTTSIQENPTDWINDMNSLYKGDADSQIRQQILLGVGGIKLLNEINIQPEIYHINEGRPGFIIWQLVTDLIIKDNLNFEEAWNKAKEKIVYTNHTLIAAGNLVYPADKLRYWAEPFAHNLGIDKEMLIKDGLIDDNTFSITKFALNISSKQSAVSMVHGKYCKKEWPGYNWIPITNGVHMQRWQGAEFRDGSLSDKVLWEKHMAKKRQLMETVIKRTGFGYDPERLVISWARRLAEYKQPKAIFSDIAKLKELLTNPERPVQLLFAGNSHSADPNAKSLIEELIALFSTELSGHAIFIPNYNISLANHLVSGSDVWLNTPKGNLEACGTSGMKACANGVLNCTVLDGWTYEVDWKDAGWVIKPDSVAPDFYNLLEKEIAPLYYQRDAEGLPAEWINRMHRSIEISNNFTSEKMFEEYEKKLYNS